VTCSNFRRYTPWTTAPLLRPLHSTGFRPHRSRPTRAPGQPVPMSSNSGPPRSPRSRFSPARSPPPHQQFGDRGDNDPPAPRSPTWRRDAAARSDRFKTFGHIGQADCTRWVQAEARQRPSSPASSDFNSAINPRPQLRNPFSDASRSAFFRATSASHTLAVVRARVIRGVLLG
jgi:hypothetical protein